MCGRFSCEKFYDIEMCKICAEREWVDSTNEAQQHTIRRIANVYLAIGDDSNLLG